MAAAQDGDGNAYARLLTEATPFIRALVRRRIAHTEQAEDVTQDVLLCVHRVRHTYDPARPFTPWLAAIADRRAIDAVRRKIRIAAHEVADDRGYETFADPAANRDVEAADATELVSSLLAALPPRQREALELVKVKQMSLAEASLLSGQSVGALKVGVHRAIKALRARLERAP
jgi:RNA polymerase sigma-70 factor (ECF subfamily)